MNIVFITHYTELYGANRSLLNLIAGLSAFDVDVHLICPHKGQITAIAEEKGIKFTIVPFHNEILFYDRKLTFLSKLFLRVKGIGKFFDNWFIVFKYASLFKGCDIIHVNSSATLIGSYFASYLKKPIVWHIREFGWEDYRIKYNFGYNYFLYWLNKANAVISISKAIYKRRVAASNAKYKEIIYNGVIYARELRQNKELNQERQNTENFTFAIIGNISPEKNQMEALTAFNIYQKKHIRSRLLIIGAGSPDYISQLTAYVKNNNLEDKVTFVGFIENIHEVYSSVNCLLMCSRNEALGRVTIEAMFHGIPVIGYAGGGTIEIITDGVNGILYERGAEELSEKMYLLSENKTLVKRYTASALDMLDNYTIEKSSALVYNTYLRCMNNTE